MSYLTIYFEDKPVLLTNNLNDIKVQREKFKEDKEVVYMEGVSSYNLQSMPMEIAKPDHKIGILYHNNLEELQEEFFKQFVIITAGGGLVTNEKNELLLILRKSKWDLPKGKTNVGETLEECALREVKEETGLSKVDLLRKIDTTFHTYVENGTRILKISHWFEMKADSGDIFFPQTEEDISDIKWVTRETMQEYLQNSYANIVRVIEGNFL